jgi:hypothetical protein
MNNPHDEAAVAEEPDQPTAPQAKDDQPLPASEDIGDVGKGGEDVEDSLKAVFGSDDDDDDDEDGGGVGGGGAGAAGDAANAAAETTDQAATEEVDDLFKDSSDDEEGQPAVAKEEGAPVCPSGTSRKWRGRTGERKLGRQEKQAEIKSDRQT